MNNNIIIKATKYGYGVALIPQGSQVPLESYCPRSIAGLLLVVEALVKGEDPPKDYIAIRDKDLSVIR